MTRNQLCEFVYRADTNERIRQAEEWLKRNVEDNALYDDLMVALSQQYRMINAQTLKSGDKNWF